MNSGIYLIQNILNGRKYVGSSRNLRHRKSAHFSDLRNKCHVNHRLQKEYDTYGVGVFRWIILERCEKDVLIEREQYWIDSLKPEYNILSKADNHLCQKSEKTIAAHRIQAEKMRGRKQTREHRQKISDGLLKHYQDPSNKLKLKKTPEQIEAIRQRAIGNRNPNWGTKRSAEFKNMIGDLFSSVEYTYISPSGEEVTFRNLMGFCKENNLSYISMRSMHQGRRKSPYLGWVFKEKRFIGYNKA